MGNGQQNKESLKEKFGIEDVPCYYWMLNLLKCTGFWVFISGEDYCRMEERNVQHNLNMLRKFIINHAQYLF